MNNRFLRLLLVATLGFALLGAVEYIFLIAFPGLVAKLIYTAVAIAFGYVAAKWI